VQEVGWAGRSVLVLIDCLGGGGGGGHRLHGTRMHTHSNMHTYTCARARTHTLQGGLMSLGLDVIHMSYEEEDSCHDVTGTWCHTHTHAFNGEIHLYMYIYIHIHMMHTFISA
jgi:hypothetical protein